jgi:nucleoside-diphosphate kinase
VAQRTFSIIKPDAVRKGYTGAILAEIGKAGFQIVAIKKQSISKKQAEGFYAVHAGKPFFDGLTNFMSSGSLILMVLEKENAIADLRKLMGHQSRQCRGRNHPQEVCRFHFGKRYSRFRRPRHSRL